MAGSAYEVLARGGRAVNHFGAAALVQALLDVEAALVQSRASAGYVGQAVAMTIAGVCKVGLFDHVAVLAAAAVHGKLAAEVADRLRETVALFDAAAAAEVHRDLDDVDALQLAHRLLVRRALAELDGHLSTIAGGIAARSGACAPASDAAEQVLRLQGRIRIAGEAALRWAPLHPQDSVAAAAANLCAQRLQLISPDPVSTVAHGLQEDEAMSLLLYALVQAGADLGRAAAVLPVITGSAHAAGAVTRIVRVEQVIGAAARRAPHHLAAWLVCTSASRDDEAAAAEAAALIESTLAAAGLLAELATEIPMPVGVRPAASTPRETDLVRRARAASPWQQWLG